MMDILSDGAHLEDDLLPLSTVYVQIPFPVISRVMLLKEVPLVQTHEELMKLELKVKGQANLIFSYQHAIGTYGMYNLFVLSI